MIINSRSQAVRNLYNNVVTIDGDDAFDEDHKKIMLDESSITTEIKRIEDEYDANEYQRSRAIEYPSIADQLDEIYHNGVDSWKAVIKQTKDKYPKG